MGAEPAPGRAASVRDAAAEAIDAHLIRAPLDFLHDAHQRQRAMLAALEVLAAAPTAARAVEVRAHLTEDVPLHHADEDGDLFPLLRRRALPEDALARLLSRLEAEHRRIEIEATEVARALDRLATGAPPSPAARAAMTAHAAAARRHLILEDAVVLPLARVRLAAEDCRSLSLRMALRRGVCLLRERAAAAPARPARMEGPRR